MDAHDLSPLLTVKQVAEWLGCSPSAIYTYVNDGNIPFCRVGRFIRFDREVLQAWLRISVPPAEPNEEADHGR